MKRFKFIYLLAAVVGALSFASCQHPYADWAPGAQDANMGVYFPETKNLVVTAEDTSVDIPVMRNNAAEKATVSLRYEDINSCGFFTVPSSVEFAAGSNESKITITFDGTQLVPGVEYPILIKLHGDDASQYGISENIFKIGIAEPWISLGQGFYRDDIFTNPYQINPGSLVPVEVFQHELEPNRYRVNPFAANAIPYILGGVPEDIVYSEEAGYLELILAEDGTVTMPADGCPTGFKMDLGGGLENMWVVPYPMDGSAAPGHFENGVFWFTTPSNMVFMSDSGNGWYANTNGLLAIALPGYEITDFAMGAVYGGMVVEADNVTSSAIINFGVGADVESFDFTVLPGNLTDITATVEAIIAGSEDLTIYKAKANELSWKVALDGAGVYTVVAVPFGKGEYRVDDAIAYAFYYPGLGGSTETPSAEIAVYFDSVVGITGNESYEEQFPAAYFAAAAIVAKADEIKSVKLYVGREDVIVGSGLEREYIASNYGQDITAKVLEGLAANGSVVLGPYNLNTGSEVTAMFIFETLYGETRFMEAKYTLPNASGLDLGTYNFEEGEYAELMSVIGAEADGYAYLAVDAFEFLGVVDAEAKTITFDGAEPNYEAYLFNQLAFYYDSAKTKAYGVWSCSDEALENACDLVLSFDENGTVTAMNNYFALCICSLADGSLVDYGFYFTPAVSITKVQPEAAKASLKASAKSMNAELKMAKSEVSFVAESCQVKREMKANVAQF